MSDFLSKFKNDEYAKMAASKPEKKVSEKKQVSKKNENENKHDLNQTSKLSSAKLAKGHKNRRYQVVDKPKTKQPIPNSQEKKALQVIKQGNVKEIPFEPVLIVTPTVQSDEEQTSMATVGKEEFVRDESYAKKQKMKRIGLIIGGALTIVLAVFLFFSLTYVKMPQFEKEKTIEEMKLWAIKNKITLNISETFSLEVDANYIINQGHKAKSSVRKGSTLDVIVSKGANPDETIKLPDFNSMKLIDIEQWKSKNKAENVTILKEFSKDVEKDRVIKVDIKSKDVTAENYKRKDRITVVVSKGAEILEKNIEVPDFKDKSKAEVEAWAKKESVEVKFQEAASNTIPESFVMSQSIAPKEKVAKNDEIIITISVGRIMYAPSFYGYSEEEAQALSMQKGVSIAIVHQYNSYQPAGTMMYQSIAPRYIVPDGEPVITLTYSLGKPYIADFNGQSQQTIIDAINQMNTQGANIKYNVVTIQDGSVAKGNVIMVTPTNTYVNTGDTITITVSSGGKVVIPAFVDQKMGSDFVTYELIRLQSQGLKIVQQYVPNNSKPAGTIIEQSIVAGTNVNTADVYLVLKIAN